MGKVLEKLVKKFAVQTAVYWAKPTNSGDGGMTFSNPMEIKVRWDEEEVITKDSFGNEFKSKAKIMTNEELDFNGWLFLGTLDDLPTISSNPYSITGAYEIKLRKKIPMVKKTDDFLRLYFLAERSA